MGLSQSNRRSPNQRADSRAAPQRFGRPRTTRRGTDRTDSLDPAVAAAFEPGAATPEVRLAQAAELIGAHVPVEARLDPILPGVTDGADCLDSLCAALAGIGVRKVAASVLFLRPAVIGSLRRHVKDKLMLNRLLDHFATAEPLTVHTAGSRVRALPPAARLEIMERLKSIAHRYGLEVLVCACKNPDIGRCTILRGPTARGTRAAAPPFRPTQGSPRR